MIERAWKSGEEYGNGGCRFVGFEGKAGIEGIVVVVVGGTVVVVVGGRVVVVVGGKAFVVGGKAVVVGITPNGFGTNPL